MSKTKTVILFIIIISSISIVLWLVSIRFYSFYGNRIEKIVINNKTFYAEVVSNDAKMQKGLGGRNDLCNSCAMLFKFSQVGNHSFWMKDMRFPLDIIWIKNGEVVYVEKNVSEKFSGTLSPQAEADSVLEINAGNADKLSIKVGNKFFNNS